MSKKTKKLSRARIQKSCDKARKEVGKMTRAQKDELYNKGLEIINLGAKYPWIAKLELKIYNKPVSHIKHKELFDILTTVQRESFFRLFGIQTCPLDENNEHAYYPWDVEKVFKQMFENYKPSLEEWD